MGSARWSRSGSAGPDDHRASQYLERGNAGQSVGQGESPDATTGGGPAGRRVGHPGARYQPGGGEGVGSSQTVMGPGHVPGTAGLGQRGNAAVVGRNAGYGGVFGRLNQLKPGDRVLTATTEGQSIYVVRRVTAVTMGSGADSGRCTTVTLETLYRHTSDNRLTLVTSGSSMPWNSSRAIEVVAILRGKPYVATPQAARNSRSTGQYGRVGRLGRAGPEPAGVGGHRLGAVLLYRRCTVRTAYLLSTAPLVAFTVLAADSVSRLLPAWM